MDYEMSDAQAERLWYPAEPECCEDAAYDKQRQKELDAEDWGQKGIKHG